MRKPVPEAERRILQNQMAIMNFLTALNEQERQVRQLALCSEMGRTQAILEDGISE